MVTVRKKSIRCRFFFSVGFSMNLTMKITGHLNQLPRLLLSCWYCFPVFCMQLHRIFVDLIHTSGFWSSTWSLANYWEILCCLVYFRWIAPMYMSLSSQPPCLHISSRPVSVRDSFFVFLFNKIAPVLFLSRVLVTVQISQSYKRNYHCIVYPYLEIF